MPMADEYSNHGRLGRSLIYGKDKTKKTWWACRAAEAGFNVILLDGDDGSGIVTQLPIAARKRILVINAVDKADRAVYARFMASFLRGENPILWDEQGKCSVPVTTKRNPVHSYVYFDISKLGPNDLVVIDSWTALAASTQLEWSMDQDVDMTTVEKEGDQFALLGFQSRFLDYCLNKIHTLPCHVIVIGHETVYEKWEGKKQDRKLVWSVTQPISSTGPQGMKLGKHFSDVLHFSKLSDIAYRIDAGGDKDRSGGSRLLEPKKHNWADVTPQLLFEKIGAKPTGDICHGAIYIPPGGELKLSNSVPSKVQIIPTTETVVAPASVLDATKKPSLLQMLKKSG